VGGLAAHDQKAFHLLFLEVNPWDPLIYGAEVQHGRDRTIA
jgi:hypothetical protein